MEERKVDEEIKLIPYYPNDEISLKWYQDKEVVKQVDNKDSIYNLDLLHKMYEYLFNNGDLFYIEYKGVLVGDVTLKNDGEIAIVISKEYENKHIGRKVIKEIIKLAKEKNMKVVKANIYSFNIQSQKMFLNVGFKKVKDEWYEYKL